MLRDSIQDGFTTESSARYEAIRRGTAALLQAKLHFELLLDGNEAWHALKQHQMSPHDGASLDADTTLAARERLTRRLAAEPAFVAWQFTEAALACLAVEPIRESHAFATDEAVPRAEPKAPTPADATEPPAAAAPPATTSLTARIPTLEPADDHGQPEAATRELPYGEDTTRFTSASVGIEEAHVKIVTRTPPKPMIDLSLPPLPFARNGAADDRERVAQPERHNDEPVFHRGDTAGEAEIAIIPGRQASR